MPAQPRLVGLNGLSGAQTRKSPVWPLNSCSRCGARSRNFGCMRVVHRSGGSRTWESADRIWKADMVKAFLPLSYMVEPSGTCQRGRLERVHDRFGEAGQLLGAAALAAAAHQN